MCIRTSDGLHLLQTLVDDLQFGNDLLNFADPVVEIAQFQRILLDRTLNLLDFGIGDTNGLLGELVDQCQLELGVGGDFLNLVLAIDVGLEDEIAIKGNSNRIAILIENVDVVAPWSLSPIAGSVFSLDVERDGTAAEIGSHMALSCLHSWPSVTAIRQHAKNVANELQHRGLARTTAANNAIQTIAEFKPRSIEKSALDTHAEDPMMRPSSF